MSELARFSIPELNSASQGVTNLDLYQPSRRSLDINQQETMANVLGNWGGTDMAAPDTAMAGDLGFGVENYLTQPALPNNQVISDPISTNNSDGGFLSNTWNKLSGLFGGSGSSTAKSGADKGSGGGWASTALNAAEIGLGVYNALESAKMNKFLRGHYKDQMALQRADFANQARSVNTALEDRQARRQSSQTGHEIGSAANQAATAAYMDKHRVDETV